MNSRKLAVDIGQAVATALHIAPGTDISSINTTVEKKIRQMVILDPKDLHVDVKTLESALRRWIEWTSLTVEQTAIQVLLDLVAIAQRPEEPPGLGAVVKDASGKHWVRDAAYGGRWYNAADGKRADFHEIDTVLVLSRGVVAF